ASASCAPRAAAHAVRPGRKLSSTMTTSRVRLPRDVRAPYEVYLNGVRQQLGADYSVREGALVFRRELRKDKISGWRWLLGAWGVGTYRQNDSVDVRYEAPDGSPRVRSEEHTSELQSRGHLVCRLLLEKKKYTAI